METVADQSNIYTAIAAAQLEFGAVVKGATNPAFKTRYADLADVAAVVIPTLAKHGVAVLHYITGDTLDRMRTEFVHGNSRSRVWCDVPLLVDRQNMQGMKSATTYAKRIGLESLSGVAPEDDDGSAAANTAPQQVARQTKPRGPDAEAVQIAVDSIGKTDAMDALQAVFTGLPADVRGHADVIAAKDARKAQLTTNEERAA